MRLSVRASFNSVREQSTWMPEYLIRSGFDWAKDDGVWARDIDDEGEAIRVLVELVKRGIRVEASEI